jgi:hypothetical protein
MAIAVAYVSVKSDLAQQGQKLSDIRSDVERVERNVTALGQTVRSILIPMKRASQ